MKVKLVCDVVKLACGIHANVDQPPGDGRDPQGDRRDIEPVSSVFGPADPEL
jgi:hypothetical protein